ncbi:hypothetical protein FB446DRAFT_708247 [Lentinula raphanica]|nr:hypothetical protein FB446DRAFT_708247 [Lentinula raphanica]
MLHCTVKICTAYLEGTKEGTKHGPHLKTEVPAHRGFEEKFGVPRVLHSMRYALKQELRRIEGLSVVGYRINRSSSDVRICQNLEGTKEGRRKTEDGSDARCMKTKVSMATRKRAPMMLPNPPRPLSRQTRPPKRLLDFIYHPVRLGKTLSNPIPPLVTYPSTLEWTLNVLNISGTLRLRFLLLTSDDEGLYRSERATRTEKKRAQNSFRNKPYSGTVYIRKSLSFASFFKVAPGLFTQTGIRTDSTRVQRELVRRVGWRGNNNTTRYNHITAELLYGPSNLLTSFKTGSTSTSTSFARIQPEAGEEEEEEEVDRSPRHCATSHGTRDVTSTGTPFGNLRSS